MNDLPYVRYVELAHGVCIDEDSAQRVNDNVQNLLAMVGPALRQSAVMLNGFHVPSVDQSC